MTKPPHGSHTLLVRIIDLFLRGRLTPLLIALSLAVGVVALWATPREEEPQIVVPMADVLVRAPGLPPEEVERQISTRLEKLLYQIDGVEYVYSTSSPGLSVVTVRFYVGENRESSLVKIYNKVLSNIDEIPAAVSSWVVKPVEIDDVPIVVATLWSDRPKRVDDYALRRIAEEIEIKLQALPQTNQTHVLGGRPRVVRVELQPGALAARQTAALDVAWALGVSDVRARAGSIDSGDRSYPVDAGDLLMEPDKLGDLVVNVVDGAPVFLKDVATLHDGPTERTGYTWIGFGPAEADAGVETSRFLPAVHISVAKQKGTNAVTVAARVEERLAELAKSYLPAGVHITITRDQGQTANNKVKELLEALAAAIVIVIGLIVYALGWREALVVSVAVPITFGLTLALNLMAGYTINRVTLFALILALGLVVDDPVVDVENIYRHLRMGRERPMDAVRTAVNEVRPPILIATLAVIVSFLPMLFISGMMGPYMRPMALNVPVAMAMSMGVAFTVTPWLAYHALRRRTVRDGPGDPTGGGVPASAAPTGDSPFQRFYARLLGPFLDSRRRAWQLLGVMGLLFVASLLLAGLRLVPLKMLPFDNKNEFQVVINMPEGMTLERTDALARRLATLLTEESEIRNVTVFSGLASPMDFNGMVRHDYLRHGNHVAELRANLVDKRRRSMQSHAILLRLRDRMEAIAAQQGAVVKLVEIPPGPPVLATLVAEVYGDPGVPYSRLRTAAASVEARLRREPAVSEVDSSVEAERDRLAFAVDQEKAALSGVSREDVARTMGLALDGLDAARLHVPGEVSPLPVRLRTPRSERSDSGYLRALRVKGRPGIVRVKERGGLRDAPIPLVPLGELGHFARLPAERAIYHKNLQPVVYVTAEPVGRPPAEVIADVSADLRPEGSSLAPHPRPLSMRTFLNNGGGEPWTLPRGTWVSWRGEGEWKITLDVFRDLGIAFVAALVGIYFLLVYQTGSYAMPGILMISIPLTLIGILPGFWLLNLVSGGAVAGHANPVFFTATAMIGMIALAGIAVRNAILLIEFVHVALANGAPLREALLRAGAIRTRPILLTAGTAMLAAIPIAFDPIFSGLAWSLIFGLLVSTAFTLLVVPVTYDLVYRKRPGHGLRAAREEELA